RMASKDAAQVAAGLAQALKVRGYQDGLRRSRALPYFMDALSAMAARMQEPNDAAAVLTQAMKDVQDNCARGRLAQGLPPLAARRRPSDASQTAEQEAAALTAAIDGYVFQLTFPRPILLNGDELDAIADSTRSLLAATALMEPRMGTKELARAAEVLTKGIN